MVGDDVVMGFTTYLGTNNSYNHHNILALIPKVSTPSRINDIFPISYCNVLYKCISKTITNRIKDGLDEVVSDNQPISVLRHSISENIHIT